MNLLKYLFLACLAFVIFTLYARCSHHARAAAAVELPLSEAGFVTLPPNDLPNGKAVIVSQPGCPKAEAKRVKELDFQLMNAGIPREIREDVNFTFSTQAEADLLNQFMGSATRPLVFVRGKVRGNPTVMEVVAEYRRVPLKPAVQKPAD